MPFLKYDNKKIYYEITGKGPVIILHHGFSMWGHDWIKSGWIKNLSKDFTCLIFDAIGHGNSSKPYTIDSYTVESRTNLVLELSKNFGWEKFSFLGFSMGGRVGYELLSNHKDKLEKIGILSMHGYPPNKYREQFIKRLEFINSNKITTLERALGFYNPERPSNNINALSKSTQALFSWKGVEKNLSNNMVPTMILCGIKDSLFKTTEQFSDLVNSSTFIPVLNETHGGIFHRNQYVKDILLGFFKSKSS